MPNKKEIIEELFKPDKETGISEWKTREEIHQFNPTLISSPLSKTKNGNDHRYGIWWGVKKYKWDTEYVSRTVSKIRTNGYSDDIKNGNRDINPNIKKILLTEYKHCIHCGNHKNLCIDHKNDMYNDEIVLNKDTQKKDYFQVLCEKCNKDLKHHIAYKGEDKTGKIHSVKDFGKYRHDYFEYPCEKALKVYNEEEKVVYINGYDIHCKMYSYWYDIEVFEWKREWFLKMRIVNNHILRRNKSNLCINIVNISDE